MVTMTREQARRFILSKQGLLGKYRFVGKPGAYQYIRQAGCIQYDPVDVCGKNAELTLQSRVRGFTRKMLADLLYKDRLLVDYTDKELSIWPREDWPFFSAYRDRSKMHGAGFPLIPELEEQAVAYIRENGPVSSGTLPIQGKVFWHSSMHWSGNWHGTSPAARSVLEQLYTDGVLLIHHKSGSRKFYVLPMLYGEKMAGRIEAAADRKAETLVIKNVWYEPGIRQTKKLNAAVDAAVRRLAKFNDCSQVRQRQTGVCEE